MNRDTYARFLRSEAYKELLIGGKKKVSGARRRHAPPTRLPISLVGQTMSNKQTSSSDIDVGQSTECNSEDCTLLLLLLVIACGSAA